MAALQRWQDYPFWLRLYFKFPLSLIPAENGTNAGCCIVTQIHGNPLMSFNILTPCDFVDVLEINGFSRFIQKKHFVTTTVVVCISFHISE